MGCGWSLAAAAAPMPSGMSASSALESETRSGMLQSLSSVAFAFARRWLDRAPASTGLRHHGLLQQQGKRGIAR